MRLLIFLSLFIPLAVSCASVPRVAEDTHVDHGLIRDYSESYQSILMTYRRTPWIQLSDSWKLWPKTQDEIVIQGKDKIGLGTTYWGNSEIRKCSWSGFLRIGVEELPLELKFTWHKYPSERMSSFRDFRFSSDIAMKLSLDELDCRLEPGSSLPKRFISLIDGSGNSYEGRAVLEPNARSVTADSSSAQYSGAYVILYSGQKFQYTGQGGELLAESINGTLSLREGLSDEQKASVMVMAAVGEILKHIVGKYY